MVAQAAAFIRWFAPFYLSIAIHVVFSSALRAAGDVMTPLWIGAIANVLNVGFVYTFVYGALGVPAMGVGGAALALLLSAEIATSVFGFDRTISDHLAHYASPAGQIGLFGQLLFATFPSVQLHLPETPKSAD